MFLTPNTKRWWRCVLREEGSVALSERQELLRGLWLICNQADLICAEQGSPCSSRMKGREAAQSPELFLKAAEACTAPGRERADGLDSVWCAVLRLFLLHLKIPFHYVHKSCIHHAAEANSCVAYRYWYPQAKPFYGTSRGIRDRGSKCFSWAVAGMTNKYLRRADMYSGFPLLILNKVYKTCSYAWNQMPCATHTETDYLGFTAMLASI